MQLICIFKKNTNQNSNVKKKGERKKKPHPGESPAVSIAGPQESDQVQTKEGTQQGQHHIVLRHSGEQFCRTGQVHIVGHHKERTPEQCEMVTQALGLVWSGLHSHLKQLETVVESKCSVLYCSVLYCI